MSLDDFEQIKILGKGSFGTVVLVKRKADGENYAMKRVKIAKMNQRDQLNALNEVRILASLAHPNICDYKESFYDQENETLNIVMEYAQEGDLQARIKQSKINKTYIAENDIWSYLIQIIHGLKSLHDKKIMHRDLKTANIFLSKAGVIKVGDLNVSKVVKAGFLNTQTGTPYYASPEVWSEKPYDYKSDIWSVGCIIYELCALRPPFRGQTLEQLFKSITKGVYDSIPSHYSKDLQMILSQLLKVNPANRPNCDALLQNPIILKRLDYSTIAECQGNLLNSIKLPPRLDEISDVLPKTKRYGEVKSKIEIPFVLDKKCDTDRKKPSLNIYQNKTPISNNKSVPPKGLRSNNLLNKNKLSVCQPNVIEMRPAISKEKYLINNKLNIQKLSYDRRLVINIGETKQIKNFINPGVAIDLMKKSPISNKNNNAINLNCIKQKIFHSLLNSSPKEKLN